MSNKWTMIFEIVIIVLMAATIFKNAKNGFVKTLLVNLKGLAAILLALALTPVFVGIVKDNFVNDWFEGTITTPFVETAMEAGDNFNFDTIYDSLPETAHGLISMIDKDGGLSSFKGTGVEFAMEFGGRLEGLLINIVANVITYVALWLILLIILSIVLKIIEKSIKIPALEKGDHILGFVWGTISAYIEGSVMVAVVSLLSGPEFFAGTFVSKFLYEYGLFSSLIERFL